MKSVRHDSFGNLTRGQRDVLAAGEAMALLRTGAAGPGSLLAYGNGRSYGDSCHNGAGAIVDMRGHNRIIGLDKATGVLEAESGALLGDIIAYAAAHGFFPAVVPGTKHVTLGGAIANDIHGKNHHRRGTFGCHVLAFDLLRSDGSERTCSRAKNAELFAATIGGMGLTGLITRASIRLMKVSSLTIEETVTPLGSLDDYFDRAIGADETNEYAVAWIDQLASGGSEGRGLLLTGNHARGRPGAPRGDDRTRLAVPVQPPLNMLNRPFVRMFNTAYRLAKTRGPSRRFSTHDAFFFPLDGVADWNRLYGPRGLVQHQSVIPAEKARKTVPTLMRVAREAGQASFLTVLKRFGALASPGMVSFPRAGYTLTLDFAYRGARTAELLQQLNRITVAAGGAVNPYKDAHMSAETFAASFPEWPQLEALRDPAFMSDFWARTAGRLPARRLPLLAAAE
ncbi:MAG: FAD-binding oxidoreductase [Rhizobiaceae bacterium]